MSTKADYFTLAAANARLQFPTPRPVDLAFPVEVEERAIKERNEAQYLASVRDTLYDDLNDPRRC